MADADADNLFSQTSVCEICGLQSKYKCPRCSLRSCSLNCSKAHKEQRGCDGERDKTAYIAMKDYKHMDLVNDYTLLEQTKRQVEDLGKGAPQHNFNIRAHKLQTSYANEGVELLLSPQGMERRRRDRTYFDNKSNQLKLSVDVVQWGVSTVHHQVYQSMTVKSILTQKAGCKDLCGLHIYIKSQDGRNVETQPGEEIVEALRGTTVIDYPVLVVSDVPLDRRWRTEEAMKFEEEDSDSDTSSVSSDSSISTDSSMSEDDNKELIIEIN